ncbi:hypothetical protein EV368DRAFT_67729 [Lentinula lateritia]|uniref:Uncharacterized protein n=1 Tax=Lentinula aff. lateritia TaxID=2804960 RepID=A0ACC1TS05_9AGAR|nr:hypothetical protein F5876DRAFT_68045 [Lentinula aff. lateritia]KAJ3849075.1 hypothetical protein EV368DRAFT_67729 [Lentinula lateritia]
MAFMVRLRIKNKIQHDVEGSIPIIFEEFGVPNFIGNMIGFDVIWVENGHQASITEGKVVEVRTGSGKSTSWWKVELGVVPQPVQVMKAEADHAGTPGISINDSPVGKIFGHFMTTINRNNLNWFVACSSSVLWSTAAEAAQSELHRAIRYLTYLVQKNDDGFGPASKNLPITAINTHGLMYLSVAEGDVLERTTWSSLVTLNVTELPRREKTSISSKDELGRNSRSWTNSEPEG